VHGTEGSFVKYGIDPQEDQLKAGVLPADAAYGYDAPACYGTLVSGGQDATHTETIETLRGDYRGFFDALACAIRDGAEPPVSPAENLHTIRILEAAYRSNAENSVIHLED
jgi:scyllo-inositol 2-dehydrogenase (NADP+)